MRFVGYVKSGGRDPQDRMMGVVIDDKVAPLAAIDAFYDDLPGWRQRASGLSEGEIPLADLTLAPPVPRDAKIVCAAINYVKHGAEAKLPTPTFPNLFARWASELVVDGAHIPVPAAEPDGLDWEVELAAIVGATTIDADEKTAAASVFGYTVANDVSGRAAQLQSDDAEHGAVGARKECGQELSHRLLHRNGGCHFRRESEARDHRGRAGHAVMAPRRTWCSAFRSSSPSRPVTSRCGRATSS